MIDIVSAMDDPGLFEPWFRGESWNAWRTVLKAAFGMQLSQGELTFFQSIAGDRQPPKKRVRELWIVVGRRGGKDSVASLITAHAASLFDPDGKLRLGERAACVCLAADKDQARIVLGYTKSYFANVPMLKSMVTRETANGFELSNSVDVTIATNSFRSVRGRTILCGIFDECAFYRDENSASPDVELYRAIKPGMTTLPAESMLIGISTPYKRGGLLFDKWRDHFGKDSDEVLVIQADSATMNPLIDSDMVAKAYEDDPVAAASEFGAKFRSDIEAFLPKEVVEACVEPGVSARPYRPGTTYVGFVDAASGTGKDSFASAIAHKEGNAIVLDVVMETRPPFSAQSAINEAAQLFKSYHISRVTGDKYAAGFVVEAFQKNGLTYKYSDKDRSAIYLEVLPLLTSGRAKLLENKRMVVQFSQLERRTSSSGKDRIDSPALLHEDLANACAGVLVAAASTSCGPFPNVRETIELLRSTPNPYASSEYRRYLP